MSAFPPALLRLVKSLQNLPGIGEKTAIELIQKFGDLEEILAHPDKVTKKNVQKNLKEHLDLARLSKKLVTIETNVPLEIDLEELKKKEFNLPLLKELFKELEFTKFLGHGDLNKHIAYHSSTRST